MSVLPFNCPIIVKVLFEIIAAVWCFCSISVASHMPQTDHSTFIILHNGSPVSRTKTSISILTINKATWHIEGIVSELKIVVKTDGSFGNQLHSFHICTNWYSENTPPSWHNSKSVLNCSPGSWKPVVVASAWFIQASSWLRLHEPRFQWEYLVTNQNVGQPRIANQSRRWYTQPWWATIKEFFQKQIQKEWQHHFPYHSCKHQLKWNSTWHHTLPIGQCYGNSCNCNTQTHHSWGIPCRCVFHPRHQGSWGKFHSVSKSLPIFCHSSAVCGTLRYSPCKPSQIAWQVSLTIFDAVALPIRNENESDCWVSPVARYLRHRQSLSLADIGILERQCSFVMNGAIIDNKCSNRSGDILKYLLEENNKNYLSVTRLE